MGSQGRSPRPQPPLKLSLNEVKRKFEWRLNKKSFSFLPIGMWKKECGKQKTEVAKIRFFVNLTIL